MNEGKSESYCNWLPRKGAAGKRQMMGAVDRVGVWDSKAECLSRQSQGIWRVFSVFGRASEDAAY